jgi:hypothetical protein
VPELLPESTREVRLVISKRLPRKRLRDGLSRLSKEPSFKKIISYLFLCFFIKMNLELKL